MVLLSALLSKNRFLFRNTANPATTIYYTWLGLLPAVRYSAPVFITASAAA